MTRPAGTAEHCGGRSLPAFGRFGMTVFFKNKSIRHPEAAVRPVVVNATAHGFRSSFRDWAAEATNFPREVAEQALAHTVKDKGERAYRRSDLLEKRRRLMAQWAAYVTAEGQGATVVAMTRPGAC